LFTNTSTGSITSRLWDFGDGSTSAASNPSHTYAPGTYTVSLTVTGSGGTDTETKTNLIVVNPPSSGATLGAITPGTAGVTNSLTVTNATPGGVVGFYSSRNLGSKLISRPGCPSGIMLGLRQPTLIGSVRANSSGVATKSFPISASAAGLVFHFQAIDVGSCSATNIVSDQL
jgi:hypothetical protein